MALRISIVVLPGTAHDDREWWDDEQLAVFKQLRDKLHDEALTQLLEGLLVHRMSLSAEIGCGFVDAIVSCDERGIVLWIYNLDLDDGDGGWSPDDGEPMGFGGGELLTDCYLYGCDGCFHLVQVYGETIGAPGTIDRCGRAGVSIVRDTSIDDELCEPIFSVENRNDSSLGGADNFLTLLLNDDCQEFQPDNNDDGIPDYFIENRYRLTLKTSRRCTGTIGQHETNPSTIRAPHRVFRQLKKLGFRRIQCVDGKPAISNSTNEAFSCKNGRLDRLGSNVDLLNLPRQSSCAVSDLLKGIDIFPSATLVSSAGDAFERSPAAGNSASTTEATAWKTELIRASPGVIQEYGGA